MRMSRWTCRVTTLNGIRSECVQSSGVMRIAGATRENRFERWFERDESRNNGEAVVEKTGELKLEENRGRGYVQNKWMEVILENK